jgi:2,3-bisphosphoglycerate-dependent phosphoglycerate mutase
MSPNATNVWLVRHGEPVHHAAGPDPVLSERGHAQARRAGLRLARLNLDVVVTSPLARARQTAEGILACTGHAALEVLDGLAEADAYAPGGYVRMEELRQDKQAFAAFLADPVGFMGADEATFRGAVAGAFEEILERWPGRRVAAVSHGLVLNALLATILDLRRLSFFAPHYASISRFRHDPESGWGVLSVNDVGHHELLQ